MSCRVFGQVRESESRSGIPNLIVQALDADFFIDEVLGEVTTDQEGTFSLEYSQKVAGFIADKPDIYLVVKSESGKVLRTTQENVQFDVDRDIELNIDISHSALVEAGLAAQAPADWMKELEPEYLAKFTSWTLLPGAEKDDLFQQIQGELSEKSSILELMKSYLDSLKGNLDNNAPPFIKLAKLFDYGITPDKLDGHYYGLPVAIRTGDQSGFLANFGNILGFLWGTTLADYSPWAGKSFSLMDHTDVKTITGKKFKKKEPVSLGINNFNKINFHPLNVASIQVLNWWMGLEDTSHSEKAIYGHEKTGGNFICSKAPSVYHMTKREVLKLDYRWKKLNNPPPFRWLIDEVVQIADGLYLGQLLYATRRLMQDYDPERPPSDYKYQHFGYFLLFDQSWNPEARRLLPHLEIPVIAPGLRKKKIAASYHMPKYCTFTFEAPAPANCSDTILDQINDDLKNMPTIMHLMKMYSDKLQGSFDNKSPYFLRLQELFNRGIGIKELRGFYRGVLVSWHAEGLWKFYDVNTINVAWMKLGRFFSPWTGKSFEDINKERLKELTDGFEKGNLPTFWGTNTQALRTPKEKFVGKMIDLAGIWTAEVPGDEAREFGYDIKNFFFIARQDKSVNENHKGKTIFQFNYRWPKLKTIPPDCYCIDELVQIAEGLYLGQLMYATELLKPYDPLADPKDYKYGMFGYFLLMDESWHQIRLNIGFDLDNT